MRVPATAVLALSALASLANAGPCGYGLTCVNPDETYRPCASDTAAEFALVAPLLQQCDALTSSFNRGTWETADKPKHCAADSPCGKLVPYIMNNNAYERLCAPYQKFVYVLYTFRGYCRGEPVASLAGDNGLLASLKTAQPPAATTLAPTAAPTTTTPAPTTATATPTTAAPTTAAPTTEPTATPAPAEENESTSTIGDESSASAGIGSEESAPDVVSPDAANDTTPPASVPATTTKAPTSAASTTRGYDTVAVATVVSATTASAVLAWL